MAEGVGIQDMGTTCDVPTHSTPQVVSPGFCTEWAGEDRQAG